MEASMVEKVERRIVETKLRTPLQLPVEFEWIDGNPARLSIDHDEIWIQHPDFKALVAAAEECGWYKRPRSDRDLADKIQREIMDWAFWKRKCKESGLNSDDMEPPIRTTSRVIRVEDCSVCPNYGNQLDPPMCLLSGKHIRTLAVKYSIPSWCPLEKSA